MSYKPDAIFVRRVPAPVGAPYPYALVPSDDRSAERLAKIPLAEDVAIKVARGRSLPQHRLFWGVLAFVAEASQWETPERLLIALKIRMGRYDLMQMPGGKVVPVPDSISFSAMTQDEFQRFMDQAVDLICAEVVPGMSGDRLIAGAQAAIGLPRASLDRAAMAGAG